MFHPSLPINGQPVARAQDDFNLEALNQEFRSRTLEERLQFIASWTAEHLDGNVALMSSFGVQSALLLHYAQEAGLDLPVASVDIAEEKYNTQRNYRQKLSAYMGLNVLTFPAGSEADKVSAMDEGLQKNWVTATISGIRASQTENRATKKFVERNARNGTLSFHPLLDWPDAKADYYLKEKIPKELHHPDYEEGSRSQGGAVLSSSDDKTECGLHI